MARPFRFLGILAVAVALAGHSASAQTERPAGQAEPPPKPYKAVAVTITNAPRDTSLEAFRKELADIAKRKDRAALGSKIAKDFFWERDFGGNLDPNKPGVDNLSAALGLEDDGGWEILSGFATEPSAGPLPGRTSAICAPANPEFDEAARNQLIEESQTDGLEWVYPRAAGLQVRSAPRANAAMVETLPIVFVHVLRFDGNPGDADPIRVSWARVATPSGKIGFVAPNSLMSPYADRLCFTKDAGGAWKIGGYVGGGD